MLTFMRWSLAISGVIALLAMNGCTEPGTRPPRGTITQASEWPFWPTQMRIHPLTRIVAADPQNPQRVIEARIEFKDSTGDIAKAVGELTISLYSKGDRADLVEPIERWLLDLRDLAINHQHFDDVTRTYLLRMEIDGSLLPERGTLRAIFVSVDGSTLTGELEVR